MGQGKQRVSVVVVGGGPAGLLLGRLLELRGIDAIVLEARSRRHVEERQRAGILEQGSIDLLDEAGVSRRLHREGFMHDGVELLVDGEPTRIDLFGLTGRRVALWPQTEVVKDLVAVRIASGLPLEFEVTDVRVDGVLDGQPRVRFVDAHGVAREIACDVVAGCDGFHGICRPSIPEKDITVVSREYPFGWLGILAEVPPSRDELVYASSPEGFALLSMRTPQISRLYLQCDPSDDIAQWSDDRIWETLSRRLARDGWTLAQGPILDKSITPMRSFVASPLRHGRLVLAGDAAHIVPPTGAKGLNLALADVGLLADAIDAFLDGAEEALDVYSDRALRRVWRAEHFSWWMTSMMHRFPDADGFDRALQRSQLAYVCSSQAAQTTLAENYVGMAL